MRNVLLLAGVAAAWSTVASGQGATAEVDVKLGRINNQYICTFDRSVPGEAVRNEAAKAAGPMMGEVLHVYRHSIKGFAVRLPAQPGSRNAEGVPFTPQQPTSRSASWRRRRWLFPP